MTVRLCQYPLMAPAAELLKLEDCTRKWLLPPGAVLLVDRMTVALQALAVRLVTVVLAESRKVMMDSNPVMLRFTSLESWIVTLLAFWKAISAGRTAVVLSAGSAVVKLGVIPAKQVRKVYNVDLRDIGSSCMHA